MKLKERSDVKQNIETSDGWRDFHVVDLFDGVPMVVRATGEEGLVFIVLTEDLLKNQNALEPGSILRIYPPWYVLFYLLCPWRCLLVLTTWN